jgi:hypothetical protein
VSLQEVLDNTQKGLAIMFRKIDIFDIATESCWSWGSRRDMITTALLIGCCYAREQTRWTRMRTEQDLHGSMLSGPGGVLTQHNCASGLFACGWACGSLHHSSCFARRSID